ncbi:hypothetical protein [Rhodococcus sp. NPDC058521]|uniref:hypothetical protein n=1 Tax=Rhodococcus sp. NPDC058521 TaxID=3346536 RepID=UPI0036674F2A
MSVVREQRVTPPASVDRAYWLLALALSAGVVETIAHVSTALQEPDVNLSSVGLQVLVRLSVYAAVLVVMGRLRAGEGWARIVLVVGLGTAGIASLVSEPLTWMLSGNSLPELTLYSAVILTARTVHLLAVITAIALMLTPSSGRFFGRHIQTAPNQRHRRRAAA